jgi:hypothetical protein
MSSIRYRIRHFVQVDEQYCRSLNNTCFVRVVHTDTGFPYRSTTGWNRMQMIQMYLKGVYHSSPERL